jgi:hypothetical protein
MARKQSLHKDSSAKKSEIKILAHKLAISPEYAWLQLVAKEIALGYRTTPGTTPDEAESYKTHCIIMYAYNKMFSKVDELARVQKRREQKDDQDNW